MNNPTLLPDNKTKVDLILGLLMILGALLIYAAGIYYIATQSEKIKNATQELQAGTEFNSGLLGAKELLDSANVEILSINSQFIPKGSVINYFDSLESLARSNNIELDISVIESTPTDPATTIVEQQFNLQFRGRFEAVNDFITAVVTDNYVSVLGSIDLSLTNPKGADLGTGSEVVIAKTWQGQMNIKLYQSVTI